MRITFCYLLTNTKRLVCYPHTYYFSPYNYYFFKIGLTQEGSMRVADETKIFVK